MTQAAVETGTIQAATLLVVEDDPDIQSVLRMLFEAEGHTVVCEASGAAALKRLDDDDIDLVVLDVMLPDGNGYEVCEQIRRGPTARLPVVMLTALGQPPNVTQGLQAGADDYVRKPFTPGELLLRVRHLLERRDELRTVEDEAAHLRAMLDLVQRRLETAQTETAVETTLRREFLHNVSTHIRALSGIAEAAVRKASPGPTREIVQQLRSRIQGAALVYEISAALQSDPVEIGSVIRTIASALKSMYRPWKRVGLDISGEPVELPLTLASPLSMITNELVTNCFKHAFPENRFGTLNVRYAVVDANFILAVEDDGVGFDATTPPGGNGGAMIAQLAQQLRGVVTWHSSPTGTRAQITLPLP